MYRTKQKAAAISAEAEGIYQELQREADERKKATQIKNGEPPTTVPEIIPGPENDQKTISKITEPEIIPIQKNGDSRDQLASLFGTNGKYVDDAVMRLLEDNEWKEWSDREIARRCAVSKTFVNNLRLESSLAMVASERKYTTKHGTVATMKTANIGKVEEIKSRPFRTAQNRTIQGK